MLISAFCPARSPFVYVQYKLPNWPKKKYLKTKIRQDDPDKDRKVNLEINRLERTLLLDESRGIQIDGGAGAWHWVPGWLRLKHSKSPKTLNIYEVYWQNLSEFLAERRITSPAMLLREHCHEYATWRTAQVKQKSRKSPSINTAIHELKLLARIMDEAIALGHAETNPCRRLGLEGEEHGIKPEITDEEHRAILTALAKEPEWMRLSYFIAINTGLRFASTRIERRAVNLRDDSILIEKPKGGKKKAFSIVIYEPIRPMIEEFAASKKAYLWEMPPDTMNGLVWRAFFDKLGMHHLCFHCTRVTFIAQGCRFKIPETVMCQMVNHGSALINRIYQRWTSDDVRRYAALLPVRFAPAATPGNPQGKPAPQT